MFQQLHGALCWPDGAALQCGTDRAPAAVYQSLEQKVAQEEEDDEEALV